MNIPESVIEPFGYDIPKLVMVRKGNDPALLAKVWLACYDAYRDAIKQWKIKWRMKKLGLSPPTVFLDPNILKLYVVFAGGKNVTCEIDDYGEFLYMHIGFNIEGDPSHYGSYLEYPDGENSDCEYTKK